MHDLIQPKLARLPDIDWAAVCLWQFATVARARCLCLGRQGSSSMEYAVFAGMIGMTLLIMFQLFGDSLNGTLTAVLHRLQATIDGARPGGGH